MTSCKPGSVVAKISLRLCATSSKGSIPACASSGSVSLSMRPLVKASVRGLFMLGLSLLVSVGLATDIRPQLLQFFFDTFVTAVDVVNAVDSGFTPSYQTGNHQTR